MSDITTLEQDIAELRAALDAMARKLDTVLVQAGKVGINMPVVIDANGATVKETPKDALDVRGHINIAADPPRIYAENDNPTSAQGPYLQLIDGSDRSNAFGLKAGGVLVSKQYNYAHPPSGDLIVQGKVGIGTPTPTQPLHVKGNAAVDGEITEGGTKLKEKYQPAGDYQSAGDYQLAGNYLASGKDAKVKNLTVTGELKIGGATISVVRCKFYRNQFTGFQGYWPPSENPGWVEHAGWESDCIMVKTNNGVVYLGPFG